MLLREIELRNRDTCQNKKFNIKAHNFQLKNDSCIATKTIFP